ncbi:MAG: phosphoribosylformylglycinamidine synthase subunit PurS [Nitriliruptoraceae bacterium]
MPRIAVDVLLKREILDPEGRAVEEALPGLGYAGVSEVRVGKHLELVVDAEGDELAERVEAMCTGFLTNPVIESYRWRVIADADRADA